MLYYPLLKYTHIVTATLTFMGFLLRGFWMLRGSPLLDRRVVRILPHIVDTLFLATGIALIASLRLPVLNQPWLLAKFAALFGYIIFGSIALRRGRTPGIRASAFALAIVTYAYIVGTAINETALSWLS